MCGSFKPHMHTSYLHLIHLMLDVRQMVLCHWRVGSSYVILTGKAQVCYPQLLRRQALSEGGVAVFSHSATDRRVLELSQGYLSGQGVVLQCVTCTDVFSLIIFILWILCILGTRNNKLNLENFFGLALSNFLCLDEKKPQTSHHIMGLLVQYGLWATELQSRSTVKEKSN